MRIVLEGKINRTYVQSLCMMFFHGEKFSQDEQDPRGEIFLKASDTYEGILCNCKLIYDGKTEETVAFSAFELEDSYERTSKTAVGKAVYLAGKKITGKEIPWGILTGIRPSKVAIELLKNHSKIDVIRILKEKYLLSADKAGLVVEVAQNEMSILSYAGERSCSIYISIPFCPTRCTYCSFISYATKKLFDLIPEYVEKICNEIAEKGKLIKSLGLKLISVYIGGGTPTTLSADQLDLVLATLQKNVDLTNLIEFTVECGRPDTITEEKLLVLKKYGVGRISVNPQSLNDEVLEKIGRRHTVRDFFNSYSIAQKANLGILNVDLIAGLDGDSYDSFKSTIDKVIDLNPENITVHSFSVKKSAQVLSDDLYVYEKGSEYARGCVDYAYKTLINRGYIPYYMYRQKNTVADLENVGYAKKDTFGIYNVLMMGDGHTILGVGAGATTKLVKNVNEKPSILRIFSHKYPYEYLQDNKNCNEEIINFLGGKI